MATENTPTPGPWRVQPHDTAEVELFFFDVRAGEELILVVEGEADARLISAAPELLQACEEAAQVLESVKNGTYKTFGRVDTIVLLRAAIAKARGE